MQCIYVLFMDVNYDLWQKKNLLLVAIFVEPAEAPIALSHGVGWLSSKLFVRGLSWSTNESTLMDAFSHYGEIIYAKVLVDHDTGRFRAAPAAATDAVPAFRRCGSDLGPGLYIDTARDALPPGPFPRRRHRLDRYPPRIGGGVARGLLVRRRVREMRDLQLQLLQVALRCVRELCQINLAAHATQGRCPQHYQAFGAATPTSNGSTTPSVDHQHHLPGPPSRHTPARTRSHNAARRSHPQPKLHRANRSQTTAIAPTSRI
ncbi:hypothetical protein QYE76_058302 [Lolium multiflorum]|uniref:RRM domain-containing protein n=1 Tax=Lolium multiflorum TaxID=4521 RepID=A0AAD8T6W0_LOLMU|nr:hypothetical protein QYE76_058302 [Lolium multiflorum]